jgi:hypothetical protein
VVALIEDYRESKAAGYRDYGRDPRTHTWMLDALQKIEALEKVILDDRHPDYDDRPYSRYLALPDQRAVALEVLAALWENAAWNAEAHKPARHRPIDFHRRELEFKIARTLDDAGVRVTTTAKNTSMGHFANMLVLVHHEIGVRPSDSTASRSVRDACSRLRALRRSRSEHHATNS